MKFGTHCYIFVDQWRDESLDVLDKVKALGLDCLDIAVGDDVVFDAARTRRRAVGLGIELLISPGGSWPVECDLSSTDAACRSRGLEWHRRQVDLAESLGATVYSGALYGHPGVLRFRPLSAGEQRELADGIHSLAEYGAARGVRIVLEPMSRFRTHVVNTPRQLMDLIALADHPNVYALLDTYHMLAEVRDYGRAVEEAAPRLLGLHACENDRGVPGGGIVPWDDVFSALARVGFDGYILLESYNTGLKEFAWRRGILQDICPDGEQFVAGAMRFLRAGLERAKTQRR